MKFTEENILEALKQEQEHCENDPERFDSLTEIINKIENLEKKNADLVKEVDLITMLDERLQEKDDKIANLRSLLKDICDEWNEICEDDCNSHGHTDTCCNVDISNAKKKMRLEIEELKVANSQMIHSLKIKPSVSVAILECEHKHTDYNSQGSWCLLCGGKWHISEALQIATVKENPTREEALIFIQIVEKLLSYEATQRLLRGYGAFKEEELPVIEFIKVYSWLKNTFAISEDDIACSTNIKN